MRRLFTLLITSAIIAVQANGEGIESAQVDVLPPVPKAAAVIEQQVPRPSLLTGAVEFSIPLYTVSVDGFNMPITLSYKSNGIKVLDEPTPTGYGWTLLPALRVSRTIMGLPDEKCTNVADSLLSPYENSKLWQLAYRCMKRGYGDDSGDSQPDIFTVALPEKVITYVLDTRKGSRKFICVGDEDYVLSGSNDLSTLTLATPTGERYVFGGSLDEIEKVNYNGSEAVPVGWYLKTLTLPSGRVITFTWSQLTTLGQMYYGGVNLFDGFNLYDPRITVQELNARLGGNTPSWNIVNPVENVRKLDRIQLPEGSLNFTYSNNQWLKGIYLISSDTTNIATFRYLSNFGVLRNVDLAAAGTYTFDYHTWLGFYSSTEIQNR